MIIAKKIIWKKQKMFKENERNWFKLDWCATYIKTSHFWCSRRGCWAFEGVVGKRNWIHMIFVAWCVENTQAYFFPKRNWNVIIRFFSESYYTTYSKTEESCWSPHIKISAMQRRLSTSKLLFVSETVVFFSSKEYRYFRCSSERRFLGRFQPKNERDRSIFKLR